MLDEAGLTEDDALVDVATPDALDDACTDLAAQLGGSGLVRSSLNRTGLLRSRVGHPDACTGPEPLAARSDPTTPQRGRASRDVEEAFEAGAVGRAHSARAAARSRRSGADENASPVRVPPRHG